MTSDDKIGDKKNTIQYQGRSRKNQVKLINMNIIQVKKYYLLIKVE